MRAGRARLNCTARALDTKPARRRGLGTHGDDGQLGRATKSNRQESSSDAPAAVHSRSPLDIPAFQKASRPAGRPEDWRHRQTELAPCVCHAITWGRWPATLSKNAGAWKAGIIWASCGLMLSAASRFDGPSKQVVQTSVGWGAFHRPRLKALANNRSGDQWKRAHTKHPANNEHALSVDGRDKGRHFRFIQKFL